jgi:hypothetical protein
MKTIKHAYIILFGISDGNMSLGAYLIEESIISKWMLQEMKCASVG